MNNVISKDRETFLRNKKKKKNKILFTQLSILIGFIILWELLGKLGIINPFITSMPSRIVNTIANFYNIC